MVSVTLTITRIRGFELCQDALTRLDTKWFGRDALCFLSSLLISELHFGFSQGSGSHIQDLQVVLDNLRLPPSLCHFFVPGLETDPT